MANKFPADPNKWTDSQGRSAQSFQELALLRAKESKSPFWKINPNSLIPVHLQLLWFRLLALLS